MALNAEPAKKAGSRKSSSSSNEAVDPSGKKPDEAEKPIEVKTEERPSEEKKDSDMKGKIKMGPEIMERKKQRPPPEPANKTCGNCTIF